MGCKRSTQSAEEPTLNSALLAETANGARTVKIVSRLSYIIDQLQGKGKVNKGQEAFFHLKLTLRSWSAWRAEKE